LTAITAPHPKSDRAEWIGTRLELKAKLRGDHLTAITDGYIRMREGRQVRTTEEQLKVKALIETKTQPRRLHEPWASMQEGSQIVALLKDKSHQWVSGTSHPSMLMYVEMSSTKCPLVTRN
jgi:hypothetical protein